MSEIKDAVVKLQEVTEKAVVALGALTTKVSDLSKEVQDLKDQLAEIGPDTAEAVTAINAESAKLEAALPTTEAPVPAPEE